MTSKYFLDTSYLLALVRKKDQLHEKAVAGSLQYQGPFVTTELILVELANSLAFPNTRQTAINVIETTRMDQETLVISFGPDRFQETFDMYKSRLDKSWGFVDCFSFIVMQEHQINIALTFDIHFKQAGFFTPLLNLD
ncbi:MAG: PIN domain-containing protein [Desulfonatronovibrio sp.]